MRLTIGIYVENDEKKLKKVAQVEKRTQLLTFPKNPLENVDQLLLNNDYHANLELNTYFTFNVEDEFNHIFNSSNPKCIIVISSFKAKLLPTEKAFLFKNISHVLLRPDSVKTTLTDIVNEPLNYIGKDLLINRIDEELQNILAIMQQNIEKAILRGESIEQLQNKALTLNEDAFYFKNKSEQLNRCCR